MLIAFEVRTGQMTEANQDKKQPDDNQRAKCHRWNTNPIDSL
jgi:hypothetical protein